MGREIGRCTARETETMQGGAGETDTGTEREMVRDDGTETV